MADTPTHLRRQTSGSRDIVEYRLDDMDLKFDRLIRNQEKFQQEVREYMQRQQEQESDHKIAIERCSTHGAAIRTLREEELPAVHKRIDDLQQPKGSPVAFWTAVGAMIAGIGSMLTQWFGK